MDYGHAIEIGCHGAPDIHLWQGVEELLLKEEIGSERRKESNGGSFLALI
jgi:hypothetical protein